MSSLISIIVPVFNVENYLYNCLNSILNQTYSPIEIIIINDGSTDNSPAIAELFQKQYPNVQIIHQINSGLSAARNSGLKVANGEYVSFIDSDDFIHPQMIEKLFSDIIKNNVSISMCGYRKVDTDLVTPNYIKDNNIIFDSEEILFKLLKNQSLTSAWAKLFKTELFKNISFPQGKLFEDMFVMPKLFKASKYISYTDNQLYYYNQSGVSITRSEFTFKKCSDLYDANIFWKDFISMNYPNLKSLVNSFFVTSILQQLKHLFRLTDIKSIELSNQIIEYLNYNFGTIFFNRNVRINDKIKMLFIITKLHKLRFIRQNF